MYSGFKVINLFSRWRLNWGRKYSDKWSIYIKV